MGKIVSKQKRKAILYFVAGVLFLIPAPFSCSYYKFAGAILIVASIILISIGIYKLLKFSPKIEVIDFEKLREIAEKI